MPRWFAGLVCAVGVALIAAGVHASRFGRETRNYTRTRGRIVRADVEETPRPSEEGGARFTPVVRYAFEVRGRTYESERVALDSPAGAGAADPQEARQLVYRYPAGTEVDVWFDPRDPGRSVLVRGVATAQVDAFVAMGVALVAIGMFALAR